jgi:hypothetical protein
MKKSKFTETLIVGILKVMENIAMQQERYKFHRGVRPQRDEA